MQIETQREVTGLGDGNHLCCIHGSTLVEDNEVQSRKSQRWRPFLKTSLLRLFNKSFLLVILISVNQGAT